MKRGVSVRHLGVVVFASVIGVTACRDNGLPDRNLPIAEARHRQYGYPAYEATPGDAPVAAGGRHYMPSLPIETIPAGVLVPVAGAAGDVPLFVVRGAEAPYSRVYAQAGEGQWRPYLPLN